MILNSPDIALERKYQPLWVALAERLDTYPAGPDTRPDLVATLSDAVDRAVRLSACR